MNHDNGCIDGLKDSGLKSINGYSDKVNDPITIVSHISVYNYIQETWV